MAKEPVAKARLVFDTTHADKAAQAWSKGLEKSFGGVGKTFKEGYSQGGLGGGFGALGRGSFYNISRNMGMGRKGAGLMGMAGGLAGKGLGAFAQGGLDLANKAGLPENLARKLMPGIMAAFDKASTAVSAKEKTKEAFKGMGHLATKEDILSFYEAQKTYFEDPEAKSDTAVENALNKAVTSHIGNVELEYASSVLKDIAKWIPGMGRAMTAIEKRVDGLAIPRRP